MASLGRFPAFRTALIVPLVLILVVIAIPVLLVARAPQSAAQTPVTSTDPGLRMKGFARHQAMAQASPFKDLK